MRSTLPKLSAVLALSALLLTGPGLAADCEDTELGEQMSEMKDHFKALRGAAKSASWDDIALHRSAMAEIAGNAADLEPMKLADLPEAKRPQLLADYRDGIDELREMLAQLDQAAGRSDIGAARDIVARIGQHTKDSHKQFKKDCD